jgi:hypothetical protein
VLANLAGRGFACEYRRVLNRWISLAAWAAISTSLAPPADGDTLAVQLFPLTGEVRFQNASAAPFNFIYYSLTSDADALNGNPAVWKSISETYDASGNGFIDALNDWITLAAHQDELTEGVIPNPGGTLAPYRSVSLGHIWDPDEVPLPGDVIAQFVQAGSSSFNVVIGLALDGNYYNLDQVVDNLDYSVWKACYGETSGVCLSLADGNLDGAVSAADYTIWRNHRGDSLAGAAGAHVFRELGPRQGVASAVPEPASAQLLLVATLPLLAAQRRFPASRSRRLCASSRGSRAAGTPTS